MRVTAPGSLRSVRSRRAKKASSAWPAGSSMATVRGAARVAGSSSGNGACDSAGNALLTVGVFSEAGSACSPAVGGGGGAVAGAGGSTAMVSASPGRRGHAKELQLRGDVGNGENAEHHDESARRLPGQRVLAAVPLGQVLLTRSHIPSYGTRTALAKATRATRPTELSTGPGDPSAWAARPTARAPERRALSPAAGAPR